MSELSERPELSEKPALPQRPAMRARVWYGAVAAAVFAVAYHLSLLMRWLDLRRFMPWLLVLGLRNLMEVTLCLLGAAVSHRFGLRRAAAELGLRTPVVRGLVFGLLASAPMLVTFALTSSINPAMTPLSVGVGCILAPFAEEVLFRAYLFRQLYRRARLGFWASALIPSILFGAGHLYQSTDPGELAGIVLITASGSVLGCWVFIRWQDSVWPIFALHALMNLWWEVFAVDDTALGGWMANGARLATIAIAVLLTIYRGRIWKPAAAPAAGEASPDGGDRGGPTAYRTRVTRIAPSIPSTISLQLAPDR